MYTFEDMESTELIIPDICMGSSYLKLGVENWKEFQSSGVDCSVSLAHDENLLMVLFDVMEPEVLVQCHNHNEMVCKDSCVEVFLQNPEIGKAYVNFEFSAGGFCHAARGEDRNNRVLFPVPLIDTIEIKSSIAEGGWRLYACIDLEKFGLMSEKNEGLPIKLRGNFFKCGDMLKKKHYISWTEINAPAPDFHRPEFFGDLSLT